MGGTDWIYLTADTDRRLVLIHVEKKPSDSIKCEEFDLLRTC